MRRVNMVRSYGAQSTISEIYLPNGDVIFSLENPWLNNQRNVSCIPEGIYLCKWLERSGSGKYKKVWHVQDVVNRTGILFHAGNYPRHTMGCILPGMSKGENVVYSSRVALDKMRNQLAEMDFLLTISSL